MAVVQLLQQFMTGEQVARINLRGGDNLWILYTREEIDQISVILAREYNDPGYSAWKRRGGWMTIKGTTTHVPYCRHIWQPQLLRRRING